MPRRISEDHKHFRDVVSGRTRRELGRLIKSGGFIKQRPDGGRIRVNVPGIEQPRFIFGGNNQGLGRGKGDKGDTVGYGPPNGKGSGQGAGTEHADGITVGVELEYFLKFLKEELHLPDMKPKPTQTYEDIKIRYNDISRIGPESLRHTRRTLLEALKRAAASGDLAKLHKLPGVNVPVPLITPINSDKRYRQYQEEFIPSSNAVIFFIRDYSGSMDDYRCDIINDMSWWIDLWISQYYKKMERCYIIHDSEAEEVSQEKFYSARHGGGTTCSSGFELVSKILETKYPPNQFNIYIFYFSDGDNYPGDDKKIADLLGKELGPDIINMVGFTEILPYPSWSGSKTLKGFIDENLNVENNIATKSGYEHVRTTAITSDSGHQMDDEERNQRIINAILSIIGKERVYS